MGVFDVYATNKSILFQMPQSVPDAQMLPGNWDAEHMAIAVPKGREAAQGLLDSFVSDVQSSVQLQQIETAAGLKGAVNAAEE